MAHKPYKPYPEFPLFPHDSGQWAKKIKGKTHYFGVWADPNSALEEYVRTREDLIAGVLPVDPDGEVTLRTLCRRFLRDKQMAVASGELSLRSFNDYADTCKRLIEHFGKFQDVRKLGPRDFSGLRSELSKTRKQTSLANEITRVRVVFRYAAPDRAGMLLEPVRFGPAFTRPSKKALRIAKAAKPSRVVHPHEIMRLACDTTAQMHAMILLAANCGMGNTDCAQLKFANLDLDQGWINYPRPKTGVGRRAHLWPETVKALLAAIASRPGNVPDEVADLVFVTKYRKPWTTDSHCSISGAFAKLAKQLGIKRSSLTFYSLRHTFQTIAKRCGDVDAVRSVMGHVDNTVGAVYDEEFCDDARLMRVSQTVYDWLIAGAHPYVDTSTADPRIIKFRSAASG
jgi:integrase